MGSIRLAIVDDEKLIREGLKIILSTYEGIEVVGLCENGEEVYNLCGEKEVDVILMDIRMPKCDGVLGTKIIKEKFKDIKILILTTFKDIEYIKEALNYGAAGYLLKDSSYDIIYEGIKSAYKGNIVIHPDVANKLLQGNVSISKCIDKEEFKNKHELSEREIEIIIEIANGLTNKEIGEKLFLTEGTIKNNISNILSKLQLRDRTQIAIFAFKSGLSS